MPEGLIYRVHSKKIQSMAWHVVSLNIKNLAKLIIQ
jgi:hypothetical protein